MAADIYGEDSDSRADFYRGILKATTIAYSFARDGESCSERYRRIPIHIPLPRKGLMMVIRRARVVHNQLSWVLSMPLHSLQAGSN